MVSTKRKKPKTWHSAWWNSYAITVRCETCTRAGVPRKQASHPVWMQYHMPQPFDPSIIKSRTSINRQIWYESELVLFRKGKGKTALGSMFALRPLMGTALSKPTCSKYNIHRAPSFAHLCPLCKSGWSLLPPKAKWNFRQLLPSCMSSPDVINNTFLNEQDGLAHDSSFASSNETNGLRIFKMQELSRCHLSWVVPLATQY